MSSQPNVQGPPVGPQIIWSMDQTGRCTLSTGPGLQDLGVRPGELVGQNLLDVYGADPASVQSLRRVLAGEQFTTERAFQGRVLSVYYQPLHGPDGSVTGALGVATDVTDQRRAEADAQIARERMGLLADLSTSLTREALDVEAVLRLAVRSVTEAVGDVGVVWLLSSDGDTLEPRAVRAGGNDLRTRDPDHDENRSVTLHLGDVSEPDVFRLLSLEPDDGAVDPAPGEALHGALLGDLARRFDLRRILRLPLVARGQLIGAVDVARDLNRGPFTDADVSLALEVTERCALTLDNALLLDAHRDAHEALVKFKALADASSDLIGIADLDGAAVYVNPRVYEMGIEPVLGDLWTSVREQAGEPAAAEIRALLRAKGRWTGDVAMTATPHVDVVRLDVFALHHPDSGDPLGTAWIAQDVTGLRAAEHALREANADLKKFKALVEASPDFIAIADLDGSVRYVNPHGRALVGLDPAVDVTATTIADYLTPEGLRASVEVEQPAVIAHGHWEGESTLGHRSGPAIPVAIASFLMRDTESGEPFALATVQRDITERLAAETALRKLAEQRQSLLSRLVDAQDAERARIAADVHDDPVQALAAVDLRLGLLRRRLLERAPDLLDTFDPLQVTVTNATERLRALLFDLEPPDLQHGLTGALSRAADEIFEGSGVRWAVDGAAEPEVPDSVRAVAYRIAREAMINARKHSSAAHVTVTVAGRDDGLEVSVIDDGTGLGHEQAQSSPGHRGVLNMQDRAAVAGGSCSFGHAEPTGTAVTLWLPGAPST